MLQSRGISDLLAAEKKAQDQIEEARKRKNKRLKDAQNEAKTEIEQFKGEREQRYKTLEQQVNENSHVFLCLKIFFIAIR
jgi:V-type H+-transporting ATPase subunit G